jgi:hypothetical protein
MIQTDGNIWTACYRKESNADNGTANIAFKTSAYKEAQLFVIMNASGATNAGGALYVQEGPTVSGGTDVSWQSITRPGKKAPFKDADSLEGNYTYDATISVAGTVIYTEASGQGSHAGAALLQAGLPITLKPDTVYSIVAESDTADTTLCLSVILREKI